MMFPHTVTVYNKYIDGGEKWQRTVLTGVLWDAVKGASVRKTGVTSADSLTLIIPMTAGAARAAYKRPKEWAGLTDKANAWTLQSGDIVALGSLAQEVIKSSAELKALDDVITITGVDAKCFGGGMAHFEVSGR